MSGENKVLLFTFSMKPTLTATVYNLTKDVRSPPPSYDECSKDYPHCQSNDPALSGYPGTQPTGHAATPGYIGAQHMGYAVQPGFQPWFQAPPECQPDVPPFFHQGQARYPTPQPHPEIPYPQGSYSGQQPQPHPNRPNLQGSYSGQQPQPQPNIPYPQGSYSGHQDYERQHLIPGQPYTTTQVVATQPVQQQGTVVTTTQPPDYLCLAILAVICFCPLGMPAIIYASDANKLAMEGKMDGAKLMAESAQGLGIAGIVIGVIAIVVIIVILVLM